MKMGVILEKSGKSGVFGGKNGGGFNSVRHQNCMVKKLSKLPILNLRDV